MDLIKTGKLISEARLKKGYTQKVLGEKIGISDKAISKWERGLSFPDVSILIPVSEVLDISIKELVMGEKNTEEVEMKEENRNEERVLKETVNISAKQIKKRSKGYKIAVTIVSVVCAIVVIALSVCFAIAFTPADGYGKCKSVTTVSVTDNVSYTLPLKGRASGEHGFFESTTVYFKSKQTPADVYDKVKETVEDNGDSYIYKGASEGLVIKKKNGEFVETFYFKWLTRGSNKNNVYLFSAMERFLVCYEENSVDVRMVFPSYIIYDERIDNYVTMSEGISYECIRVLGDIEKTVKEVEDFYKENGHFNVERQENSIIVREKNNNLAPIKISFSSINNVGLVAVQRAEE